MHRSGDSQRAARLSTRARRTASAQRLGAVLAGTAAILTAAVCPGAAQANPYTVNPCLKNYATPDAGTGLLSPNHATATDQCHVGDGYQVRFIDDRLAQVTLGETAGLDITVPSSAPNAKILSVTADVQVAGKHGSGTSSGGVMTIDDKRTYFIDWASGTTNPQGPVTHTETLATPARSVSWHATCNAECDFVPLASGGDLVFNAMSVTLDDPKPPNPATFVTSGLLSSGAKSGTQYLTASVSDDDSGVGLVAAYTGSNPVPVGSYIILCNDVTAAACQQSLDNIKMEVDTSKLPPGPQTLRVETTDFSGQVSETETPTFTVAGPAATPTPSPTPTPNLGLVTPTVAPNPTPTPLGPLNGNKKLGAFVVGLKTTKPDARPDKVATTIGRPVTIAGRLLASDGTPMPHASLDIVQTLAITGAGPHKLATITTDDRGQYTYTFTAASSGDYAVEYADHVGSGDYTASRVTRLAVQAKVSIKRTGSTRHGKKMTLSGRVSASPIPVNGAHVEIQYHSISGWQSLAFPRTDGAGNYRWDHVFKLADTYRFRARVVADPTLAASPANSKEIRVRIR